MANSWEQVKPFYPKEMGKQKGWCLQNCRLGYRIYTGHYKSASLAMAAAKRNGTYHAGTPPLNIAVPVYTVSTTRNGHVVVCDKGTWYTDGKRYTPKSSEIYGWDEIMDGVRVVRAAVKKFLPAKGYWCKGDKDDRIAVLAKFMRATFPKYTPAKALGPEFGPNLAKSVAQFQCNTGLYPDSMVGPKTYAMLQKYGFKY